MKYQRIPNTDLNLSVVTLGTWVFGGDMWGGSKEQDCLDAVAMAADCGINVIDTAPIYGYGLSETIVGKAIKGKRDKFIIATKCGLLDQDKNIVNDLHPDSVRIEVEASLKRLQIDCIDIYQCHWPDPGTPIEDTMECMVELQKEGKIKYIGVSNFDVELLERAGAMTKIATLQNQYSILERSIEENVLPYSAEQGIGIISYGTLAGGILSGKYSSAPNFKGADVRSFFYKHYSGKNFDTVQEKLEKLKELNQPLNQVAINWCRQQKGITSAIVGARHPEQVRQNAAAAEWDLTESQIEMIKKVYA